MGGNQSIAQRGNVYSRDEYVSYDDSEPRFYMNKEDVQHIRYAKKGIAAREADGGAPEVTLPQALKRAAERWGDKPALAVERPLPAAEGRSAPPSKPLDQWKTWTYQQYWDDVQSASKGMIKLGAAQFDGVNILGFNSPEWFMAEMSAMTLGGKAAGIYPTDTPEQIVYKTELSDASIAVVDDEASFKKYASIVDKTPYLKAIVCWSFDSPTDVTRSDGSVVKGLTWNALVEMGRGEDAAELNKRMELTQRGHCAALVFTSGTTGNPKAVMISHDGFVFESYTVLARGIPEFGAKPEQERVISYLPLSHVAGMMVDIISPMMCTAFLKGYVTVYFARPYDLKVGTLGDRLRAIVPTLFLGVPRVWEKIAEKMKAVGAKTTGFKKTLSTWAKAHSLYYQKNCLVGGDGASGWGYSVANVLLTKIKEALGLQECKFMFSGAAPMTLETLEYFAAIGINVNEVYGMSECSGATTWSTDKCHKWNSIGYELDGCECKIFREDGTEADAAKNFSKPTEAEQGEVCFRGRHIMMGYLANPRLGAEHVAEMKKKNEDTIDKNGFLHSGDKGSKDTQNMFRITGRYKELIIGAGGENIAPVPIEDCLKARCPIIANAMMVGDKRKFNVVLVTLKAVGASGEKPGTEELDGDAAALVPGVKTIREACKDPTFIKTITDAITATNKDGSAVISNASKIQKFTILDEDFSVEKGILTPSLKLKRSVCADKYIKIIDALYASSDAYVDFHSVGL